MISSNAIEQMTHLQLFTLSSPYRTPQLRSCIVFILQVSSIRFTQSGELNAYFIAHHMYIFTRVWTIIAKEQWCSTGGCWKNCGHMLPFSQKTKHGRSSSEHACVEAPRVMPRGRRNTNMHSIPNCILFHCGICLVLINLNGLGWRVE